jgi:hypothetical protein
MRVGVELRHKAVVVFWPSLHISVRRRLRAEGRDPDKAELLQGVQLTGRILRPFHPGESYEDALRDRYVVLADRRFLNHVEYLKRYFEIEELPSNL